MNSRQENLLKQLRRIQQDDRIGENHFDEMIRRPRSTEAVEGFQESRILPSKWPAVTPEAVDSWNKLQQSKPLSETDLIHLESIILPALRPAFDIESDSYENLPSTWQVLNDQRPALEPLICGIGRIDLSGHPSLTFVGTGFVCGDSTIITNRHVAQIFTQGVGGGAQLSFLPGITSVLNMKEEVGSSSQLFLDVAGPVLILDEWDVALFQVGALPENVRPLPLASSPPSNLQEGTATIIGYPAFDPAESLADQSHIFRGVFNKKRLQPGKLRGILPIPSFGKTVQSLGHDCSTLGGNSGSALIDAASAHVVGLHFAGTTHVANFAVPTWELLHDPRVVACNLNFVS